MDLRTTGPVLQLDAGEVVTLDGARGTRIAARAGSVWVTEEADLQDHIVGPGETFVVARDGRTVVQALERSSIAIRQAANDDLRVIPA